MSETTAEVGADVLKREGARDQGASLWQRLGKSGQLSVLLTALIVTAALFLATAQQVAAGSCSGTTSLAQAEISSLMPPIRA